MNMLLVFLSLFSFPSFTRAADPTYAAHICSNITFTTNTVYQSNLNLLLASLSNAHGFSNGFYIATAGENPNKVYGLFLCRGDVNTSTCKDCVTFATKDVTQRCPFAKQSIMWYDQCRLRYSNEPFFSIMESKPSVSVANRQNHNETDRFDQLVWNLITEAVNEALNASNMFATIKHNFTSHQVVYGLAQCTPDLSTNNCSRCLREATSDLLGCCTHKGGGRVLNPSCNIRYEVYPFYFDNKIFAEARLPSPPFPSNGRKAIWITTGTTVSAIILLLLFGYFTRRMWRRNKREQEVQSLGFGVSRIGSDYSYDILQDETQAESQDFPLFPLALILEATQNFSDENKLGEGGFGPVYKGILADGKDIAVKRLSRTSGQGLQEFKNEVTLIAKLQHKNLVRLLGCCLEGNELLLIYEYMPNKSLDFLLFDSTKSIQLDWKRRTNIINDIARGLLYLHEDSRLKVIHRDLKASNILLDFEMNPRISDFGMARIFGRNQDEANTNRVVGTYGYMAPEYAMEGLFSIKSDVFSFGVLILEIISGKKNNGFYLTEHRQSLLNFTWKLWCEGQALELMDPVLAQSCVHVELLKYIHIGLLCVQEDPADRPPMSSVAVMLASDTVTLPKPSKPAFLVGRVVTSAQSLSDILICSINEVTLTNLSPR